MAQKCFASISDTGLHCAWCVTRLVTFDGCELTEAYCEKHNLPCQKLNYFCSDFIGYKPDYRMTDEEEFKAKVDAFVEKNKKKFYRKDRRTLNANGVPSRKVIQKDKNGIVVGEYESITVAAQANGVLHTSIVNNLKGRSKYCGGYKYEYK